MAAIVNGDEMEESFNQILKMLSKNSSGSSVDGNEFIASKIRALQASLEKGKGKSLPMQQSDLFAKLQKEEGKRRPFTGDSVTNTAKFLEDNKGKKKMVYLFAKSFSGAQYPSEDEKRLDADLPKWYTANADAGSDVVFERAFDMASAYPLDHHGRRLNIKSFGSAVWRGDIYLVGGEIVKHVYTSRFSDEVWIFTPTPGIWKQGPSMKLVRMLSPMVVPMENRLCVFGGCDPSVEEADGWWAEIYDGAKWEKFPSSIPKSLIKSQLPVQSHAVHGEELFLWAADVGIFSYSFVTATWKIFKIDISYMKCYASVDPSLPISFEEGPTWSAQVAVVGDFLFWNFHETIYACDLLTHDTRPVHTLRDFRFEPYTAILPVYPTFFVHFGDGKLCLFHIKVEHYKKFWVCYDTFLIKIEESQGTKTLDLVHHSHGECDIQANWILSVMEVQA